MPPRSSSRHIATLGDIQGSETGSANPAQSNVSTADLINQLTNAIRQQHGAATLPTGAHIDYTLPDILPADDDDNDPAFQGHGHVLGRRASVFMYDSASSARPRTRNLSDSSTVATHGSFSIPSPDAVTGPEPEPSPTLEPSIRSYNLRPRRQPESKPAPRSGRKSASRRGRSITTRARDDAEYEDLGDEGTDDGNNFQAQSPSQTTQTVVVVSDAAIQSSEPEQPADSSLLPPQSPPSRYPQARLLSPIPEDVPSAAGAAPPAPISAPNVPVDIPTGVPDDVSADVPAAAPQEPVRNVAFDMSQADSADSEEDEDGENEEDVSEIDSQYDYPEDMQEYTPEIMDNDNNNNNQPGTLTADEQYEADEELFRQMNASYDVTSDQSVDGYPRDASVQGDADNVPATQAERLEQALVYLSREDATNDPEWHERFAQIEELVNSVQGVDDDDDEDISNRYAGIDEGLARALIAAEAALAAEGGRPQQQSSYQRDPPNANTQQALDNVIQMLEAHREFNRRVMEAPSRATILAGRDNVPPLPSDPTQSQIQTPTLSTLLQTSGRSFARRLIFQQDAEHLVRLEEAQEAQGVQDQGQAPLQVLDNPPNPDDPVVTALETHPYTVQMDRYRRFRQHWMQQAREIAEVENSNSRGWATLPPFEGAYSLGSVGAAADGNEGNEDEGSGSVSRLPLPVSMERDRRLLVLLRGLGRLLLRRLDVAPRPLLTEVYQYVEQGLRGDEPDASMVLHEQYDLEPPSAASPATRSVRRINETEARWLQFLLSDSTNEALSKPLPNGPYLEEDKSVDPNDAEAVHEKVLEEGTRAMYHTFAHRLQAILDDPGRTLFRTAITHVPVADLMAAINGVPSDPEARPERTEKTQFCIYDVLQFLARLSRAGRCRFHHQPFEESHGFVQRPVLDVHPEHRIYPSWANQPAPSGDDDDEDKAIGAPNRSVDVDTTWAETLASGRAAQGTPLSDDVSNFFHALAFRFGRTLRELESVERPRWAPYLRSSSSNNAMQTSIRTWHSTYQTMMQHGGAQHEARLNGIPTSFAEVIQYADPTKFAEVQAVHGGVGGSTRRLAEKEAHAIVQHHLIEEAASGRAAPLTGLPDTFTSNRSASVWDWAHPSIVGEAPQYFHMDRWPLHLQTPETAARTVDQARIALDPELLWDPASEDPASPEYLLLFGGPGYGYQRTTRVDPEYHLGDTALQRQVLVRDLTQRVADSIGFDLQAEREELENRQKGFFGWLGSKLPFGTKRKRNDADADDDEAEVDDDGNRVEVIDFERTEMPTVKDYPKSIDWMSIVRERIDAIASEQANGRGDEEDVDLMELDGTTV